MKRILFALLLVSSTASASPLALRGVGLKLDATTGAPTNCTAGTLCLWRNGNTLTLRATDGTDSAWGGSIVVDSPLAGLGTSASHLTCTTCATTATANTFTKSQNVASVALTDASSIATDSSLGNVFTVTLGGNRTLANPTNLVAGGTYIWIVTQDATGSRTLAYGTLFAWPTATAPTLSATAAYVDLITAVYDGTKLRAVFTGDLR